MMNLYLSVTVLVTPRAGLHLTLHQDLLLTIYIKYSNKTIMSGGEGRGTNDRDNGATIESSAITYL